MALAAAIVLAFVLGFAAHRASVCAVRAVAEFQHAGTAFMAASIGKSMLWVLLVTLPFFLLTMPSGPYLGGWALTATAVAGGFLFGIGAGINGACAYSTMTRLADGEGRMAATVAGFALGVFAFTQLVTLGTVERPVAAPTHFGQVAGWAVVILVVLVALALYELARIWRRRDRSLPFRDRILARQYRLSTAALIVGLCGAGIYLLFGSAGYTSTFELVIEGALGTRDWPATGRWLLLIAVLAGMLFSTLQRRSFRPDLRPRADWLRNIGGGVFMGLGAAMAPGGNDVLVLYAVPTFSPHAIPALVAMVIGVFGGLAFMKAVFGIEMQVSCKNDCYISG
ncbi:MAG TPA: YeeE/YedE thiosulfate transporter family protein [Bauldia sp.]|nr:YeeE/YedE thiosulfate transporter family protein [Bauldia sp.]